MNKTRVKRNRDSNKMRKGNPNAAYKHGHKVPAKARG